MNSIKKLLAIILAVSMSFSHISSVYAETDNDQNDPKPTDSVQLEIEELDPSSLNVEKLGTVDEVEKEELELSFGRDDIVRVSIVLDKPSTIDAGYSTMNIGTNSDAINYREAVKRQQAEVTRSIEEKLSKPLNVKWNLTLVVNIISAEVKYSDINLIRLIPGVKKVFLENRYEALKEETADPNTANTSTHMVGAVNAWADGYTGAGSRIAIIDTGIDTYHQSVDADAFNYAINQLSNNPTLMTSKDIPSSGLNGKGTYVSAKIPYGYNYVDGNTTINHLNDTEGEHGSHVAGIAAANRYIKSGSSYVDAAANVHAVGMAPDAQLLIMKVFGKSGGAYDSDYMAAIEDAIVLGCDSANLSLGSAVQGFTFSNEYQTILNNLNSASNNKMVVVISAGNSYGLTYNLETDLYIDDVSMHTGGSPGTYVNSLCVAAAQNVGETGTPLKFNNNDIFYTDTGKTAMNSIAGTYSFVYIDAVGEAADYKAVNSAASLSGKIVIVNRGSNTFSEKANNAKTYSPKALIVANNQSGSISMNLDDFTGTFPAVSISLKDAEMIKANSTKKTTGSYTYYTGSITVTNTTVSAQTTDRADAVMTDFSSWGIPGSMIMKPEITAPGGDIYSIFGTNKTDSGTTGGSDKYELMSGTSMAAPHITGLAAVVAQYLRDSKIVSKNSELSSAYSTRAIVQSLLMSTATPMKNDGKYVSILQQGAGLAEVHKAVTASSVVMVGKEDNTLTAKTNAAADGKVKIELGDDPARTGQYTYSFTIYNLTDTNLKYSLKTDFFTQDRYTEDGHVFMAETTTPLNITENYIWESISGVSDLHDVDKDGDTDQADAQALAEYLAGNTDGSNLNLAKAEMDNDGKLSSHDVYLLLNWLPEEDDMTNTVPANGSRKVTVEIKVNDTKLNNYPSGAYIEGFTNIECVTVDGEGKDYGHVHSIPVLGFYGSWTDPSMFDNTSYIDTLYNEGKTPYTGNSDTNYVQLTYNGVSKKFSGNPYMVESEFPAGRLAVNSSTTFNTFKYNLLRAAGTVGFAVSKIDDYNGNVTSVMNSSIISSNTEGIWYYQQQSAWQNTTSKSKTVSVKLSDLALNEGDKFRIGLYAIPEYNAMKVNNDYSSASAGVLGSAKFNSLLLSNVLGKGALVGYDFAVDNTKPVISSATLSGKNITVNASDNMNLAYLAVMSLDGTTKYAEVAPGTSTYSITFDATTAINNAKGYVAVFAGDYAGNENAMAIKVNDNTSGVDPYTVTSISLTPTSLDLYKGNEADLTVNVSPLTANNREVTWSSDKTSIATVDANGHVVAVGKGTAIITATSKANTSIKATCNVNVTSVDKALNGIVWDEEGFVYFSSFNSSSLPAWSKLHTDDKQLELQTAFMNNTSDLYTGTMDSEMNTVLYKVNRSNYELTEFGTNYVTAFDIARAKSGYFVYVFGNYAIIGNLNPKTEDGETFSGLPYGVLDFKEKTGSEAYLCGIAIKTYGSSSSVYYLLDEDGKIWQTTLNTRNMSFGTPSLILDTGIPTSFMYQSLYYGENYIFWSHYNGSETELIIVNPSSKTIYHAGNFGEGVWPVAGLYVNGSVAPAAIDDETDTEEYNPDLTPVMTRGQLITDEVIARFNSEYNKMNSHESITDFETEKPANEVVGSTESIKGYNFIRKETETTLSNDGNTSIVLSEDEETTNGVYVVEYDNTILNNPVVSFNPANEVKAFRIDESTGTIKIVYAAKNGIEANDEIAEIAFDEPIDNTVVTITTVERSNELSLHESSEVEVTVTEEREAVRMMTTNLLLEGNIGIQYKTRVPDAENTKVVIHYENGAYEDVSYLASEGKHIEGTDEYWYKVPVTSIEMGDTVSIWFTDLEGNKVPFVANSTGADLSEKGAEYSVRKYIERKLNDPDETLRALVRAIKDYGDYAQLYFDYKVDEVEAGEIGDISQGELIGYKKGREGTDPSGITVKESNLLLGSETTIQYKMILEDDSTIGEYEFRMNGEEAKAEKVGSYWIVRKENVSADLLDEMYEFEVRRAGEANVSKYRYGAFSYIYSKLGGNDEGLKELCKAIYWYSKATESYMENH